MKENQTVALVMERSRAYSGPSAFDDGDRLVRPLPECKNETLRAVERSIAYMREHVNRPLQVATLAAFANVSPSHFFALFKQLTGCPPMDYFTRLRMRHACRLLDSTTASVKEVAAALGYDDAFYFSRVFKAVNHVPPSRYRAAQPNFNPGRGDRTLELAGHVDNPAAFKL